MCVLILVKQVKVCPHDGMVCWPQSRRENNAAHVPTSALFLQVTVRDHLLIQAIPTYKCPVTHHMTMPLMLFECGAKGFSYVIQLMSCCELPVRFAAP